MTEEAGMMIHSHVRNAISDLMMALKVSQETCSTSEFEEMRRGVAECLATLDTLLLDVVYSQYPELDELRFMTH